MFIDFTKLELPEGTDKELLNNEAVQGYLKSQFESRMEISTSGLVKNRDDLKAEKNALAEQIKALGDIDPEEYKSLKEFKASQGDNGAQVDRLKTEYEARLEAVQGKLELSTAQIDSLNGELTASEIRQYVAGAITEHNLKFPTVRVKDGAEKYLIDKALTVFKKDEKGITPYNGDQLMTGADGIMKGVEWVNDMRSQEPLFFDAPTGSGANGSNGQGGNFNPTNLGGSKQERKAAIAAKFQGKLPQ